MKDNLKRVIVDFKKLTPEILALLVDKYPDGYDDDQIISFKNARNELIEAVEVTTADTKYLVKVSTKLQITMENYDEDDYDDYDSDDPEAVQEPDLDADISDDDDIVVEDMDIDDKDDVDQPDFPEDSDADADDEDEDEDED
ncbi:hypothetical protein SAMN03097699_3140 [Flavobacteriaceae bacterium MAR_2010_188]|nr:hypothetical protein SAMN03097699_3140 [Flavobacteriaceae bacterium MAR_2010_188]